MPETLSIRINAPVAEIILNQPDKRNAINGEMWQRLKDAVATAENDPNTKVVIVRGEGDHFAAGADISEFEKIYADRNSTADFTQTMLGALSALEQCAKPTLAAIKGVCVGGGCSVALACDLRVADDTARFGVTPAKLGLVYSLADTRRLAQAVGVSNAKELLFTGRLIDAKQARSLGLCDRVERIGDFDAAIQNIVQEIASTSQWSAQATKQTFQMLSRGYPDDHQDAMALMLESFEGDDFKEGFKAFMEKRKADFPTK